MFNEVKKARKILITIATCVVGAVTTGTFIYSQSKAIVSDLVVDSTKAIVSDSMLVVRIEIKEMFQLQQGHFDKHNSNLLELLVISNPRFKKAALRKLEKDKENAVLREALKSN